MEWNRRCFSAGNPRKLKMPAVLKGSVAFQREGRRVEGGVELTLDSRTDLAAAPFTETPSKGSLASRCALQSSPAPEAPRLCARPRVKWRRKLMTLWRRRPPLQEGGPLSLSFSLSTTVRNCTDGEEEESWKKGTVAASVCLALADIYPCRHGK